MNRMYSQSIPFFGLLTQGFDALTTPSLLRRQAINWSADARDLVDHLLEMLGGQPGGIAAFHLEMTRKVLLLACDHPDGPPRCVAQLLVRLDYEVLVKVHGPVHDLLLVPREHLIHVRHRCQAVFSIS